MIEGRTANIEQNKLHKKGTNSGDIEFIKLKEDLVHSYPVTEQSLESLYEKISFAMGYNQISAQEILFQVEAEMLTKDVDKNTVEEKFIIDTVVKSLDMCVEKNEKAKGKKKGPSFLKNTNTNPQAMLNYNFNSTLNVNPNINDNIHTGDVSTSTSNSNQKLTFDNFFTFNEKNHQSTSIYNPKDISYTFFSNLEIKEYTLVPKDDEVKFDEYQKYFLSMKQLFLDNLGVEMDNPLMDIDKFFLLVTFENTEGRPVLTDIILVDPMKNYTKYYLKIENENYLKDHHFFCGQMIYIEGHLKNNEIFAQKIIFGINNMGYLMNEQYVRGFYQEPNPYVIYTVNGPIFNKTDINLNVFLQTMNHIADDNPHALILCGPILNCDNAKIASGDFSLGAYDNANYFDAFDFIIAQINNIFIDKRTTIILCPSLSDATTFYPLPLPPYNFPLLKNAGNLEMVKRGRIKLIGNPQIFQLNEIIFGLANFDVVKDMISNSIRMSSNNKTPLDSSLEMILQQRSFYPLLPNTIYSDEIDKMDKVVTIDERKLQNLQMATVVPDIILTSSSGVNPFVKKVTNNINNSATLFANPGHLFKGNNLGSFLKMTCYPPNNFTGIDIINRLKVEISKVNFK